MYNVEVLMSTYNGEKYLEEQLKSIFIQEGCNVHVLVRDDGSTDHTIDILERYKKQYNLDYYTGENLQPARSFMHLVGKCGSADYYAFSDQDDIWKKDKLIRAISCIEKQDYQNEKPVAYCSNLTPAIDAEHIIQEKLLKETIATEYTAILSRCSDIFGCTMVWNCKLQGVLNILEPVSKLAMHDYWVALIASCYGAVLYDSESSILYRQHEDNQVGAGISEVANWKGRLSWVFKKTKFSAADSAEEMLKVMDQMKLECLEDYKNYTKTVASYRKNLLSKIKYLKIANMSAMSFKQKCFHVLLVLVASL